MTSATELYFKEMPLNSLENLTALSGPGTQVKHNFTVLQSIAQLFLSNLIVLLCKFRCSASPDVTDSTGNGSYRNSREYSLREAVTDGSGHNEHADRFNINTDLLWCLGKVDKKLLKFKTYSLFSFPLQGQ